MVSAPSLRRLRLLAGLVPVALAATPASAAVAGSSTYTRCADVPGTVLVDAARVDCPEVERVAERVAATPPDGVPAILRAQGWKETRVAAQPDAQYDLVAVRGTDALRIRLNGRAPSLDGWAAGRELVFSRRKIVGGRPIPRDAAFCTSAFLVRLRSGSLGGLSAGHCGGLRSDRTVQRHNAALRRPPQPGIVLGRVQRILSRSASPIDALLLPVPQGAHRSFAGIVERGVSRPPWAVAGTGKLLAGRRICFTGRTSGVDNCGQLRGSVARPLERSLSKEFGVKVRCSTITARPGDSGGPVYTRPGQSGKVYAIGIVTLVYGPLQRMCFTPIAPVLSKLRASVVKGT